MSGVSAIIVTRGNVDLNPLLNQLPREWELVVWDNGTGVVTTIYPRMDREYHQDWVEGVTDLAVYGRYAAIQHASHDLIYVQDDDCVVSDPQAIVEEWMAHGEAPASENNWTGGHHVVCNMPQRFRHDFYREHALVGFGAAFHRDAPQRAFAKIESVRPDMTILLGNGWFNRCCDVVFTALTPRVLVDVPVENLPYAEDPDRMYRQPGHVAERTRMLELALRVRD